MSLTISFHGAVAKTTGSAHLLQMNNKRLLLDCGMIQGLPYHYNEHFSFDPESIDYLALSHAHLDHVGRLPLLVKQGFEGPIYCTKATKDLAKIILLDAVEVAREEAKKTRRKPREEQIHPLYNKEEVYQTLKHFVTLNYQETHYLEKNLSVKLFDAGHILGSAQIVIDFKGTKTAFTGDLGQNNTPLLRDPAPLPEIDYLITESTYGDRNHPPMKQARERLIRHAKHTAEHGGKLLIPSFAIGRTQMLIYFLNELFESGELDKMPVYIDSPMAVDATEIFLNHPECYDKETLTLLRSGDNPLKFPELHYSRSYHDSRRIRQAWETCIVFAGSGMCTGGRILSHLQNDLPTRNSVVLFVGFQAKNTLGRELVEGAEEVEIYDKKIPVRATIEMIRGFSAHADKTELKNHISQLPKAPKKTFVVHGEAEQSLLFAADLRNTLKIWARVPEYRDVYHLT
ncbi:MAG: MBL fold metallo-hydrolase RNA specificity domain-containing protein [Asgard group archaeon]|nr:MBL fold metallo-hydrolase RNA specificity domain-containing protein [Asgard group archaeon]